MHMTIIPPKRRHAACAGRNTLKKDNPKLSAKIVTPNNSLRNFTRLAERLSSSYSTTTFFRTTPWVVCTTTR